MPSIIFLCGLKLRQWMCRLNYFDPYLTKICFKKAIELFMESSLSKKVRYNVSLQVEDTTKASSIAESCAVDCRSNLVDTPKQEESEMSRSFKARPLNKKVNKFCGAYFVFRFFFQVKEIMVYYIIQSEKSQLLWYSL